MKRGMFSVAVAALAIAACTDETATEPELLTVPLFSHEAGAAHGPEAFRAHASGREEVPERDTRARGQAIFQVSADGTELHYKLIVANIQNVTQAHIHMAPAGANGPVVLWLYPAGPPAQLIPGRSQGILAEGTVGGAQLVGPLAGQPLSALVDAMRAGNTYVNVHTTLYPPGEVRGQIH
jgi:hypothetical protein